MTTRLIGALLRAVCVLCLAAGTAAAQDNNNRKNDRTDSDGRDPFMVSGYFGSAIDNFAPASVGGYVDPQAGGMASRFAGGVDFEFRVTGRSTSKRQLWLFGETLHGVRSADVDCSASATDKPPVCGALSTVNGQDALKFVIDHATTLEAYAGARYEFLTLQTCDEDETDTKEAKENCFANKMIGKLYLTARVGVMMLSGDATVRALKLDVNHAYEAYHFGAGIIMPKGLFRDSYIEVGFGRTDLFLPNALSPWRRVKVDGYLAIPFTRSEKPGIPRAFIQIYSDFDPTHKTADSVQTFYGVEFDLVGMFKKN